MGVGEGSSIPYSFQGSVNGMAQEEKSVKIVIDGTHFARLSPLMAERLEELEPSRNEWLSRMCRQDFGFRLESKLDIITLREKMDDAGYENTSDWVRDKYRQRVRQEKERGSEEK